MMADQTLLINFTMHFNFKNKEAACTHKLTAQTDLYYALHQASIVPASPNTVDIAAATSAPAVIADNIRIN